MTDSGQDNHKRRPRYSGTHPKKFDQKYKELQPQKYPDQQTKLRAKGKTPAGTHVPVLVEEIIACLRPKPGDIIADCTLGYGGHARQFLKHIGETGMLIGFDMDGAELEKTKARLQNAKAQLRFYHSNYAGIEKAVATESIPGFDIIFADLGVSSMQVDNPARGISYKQDGPLDMRMDSRIRTSGSDLLATISQHDLSAALWELSDDPDHEKIAKFIVASRCVQPITTVGQLLRIVLNAKGLTERTWKKQQLASPFGSLHPAARTFQAIRILVNDELNSLKTLLRVAPHCLKPAGRIGIISFHSGEDRLVKNSFKELTAQGVYSTCSKSAVTPRTNEIMQNPRSSSAKFRWAIKAG